ncbi:MAG: molybdopterin-synthase adenylyltransferase MoeB [bacterium]
MKLDFTEEQIRRYSRHIVLPQVGGRGQKKLLSASVLVVGAGGLGCPAIYYLAAAGVGTIGVADSDTVEISNLQRQILHSTRDLDRPKALSAKETAENLNPDVRVVTHETRLTSHNIMDVLENYGIVVDGCDNFPTRYLVNDACVMKGKPLVHGSVFQFEGQATVFLPGKGPCYRCIYPDPPPPGMAPSCQEAGVVGVLPGIIGLIQALETVKLILGAGNTLAGRLLLFDGLRLRFREMKVARDPKCPVCGDNPTVTELIDYDDFCNVHF